MKPYLELLREKIKQYDELNSFIEEEDNIHGNMGRTISPEHLKMLAERRQYIKKYGKTKWIFNNR